MQRSTFQSAACESNFVIFKNGMFLQVSQSSCSQYVCTGWYCEVFVHIIYYVAYL